MFRAKFSLSAVSCLLSVTVAALIFAASPKLLKAQPSSTSEIVAEVFGEENNVQNGVCLTDEKRAAFQKQLQSSIDKLRGEGKIAAIDSTAPTKFIFPVRGNGAGEKDYGVHYMGQFVDHNPSFPNQLLDYNCGTRTYDLATGYNHKGIDIINFPFAWNKMDNNETVAIAAAEGQIVFKADGNFDRNCNFNNPNWNIVVLRHADGTISWYGHLKLNTVTAKAVGEMVSEGEYLGVIGSSGSSTIPHLHFEVYNAANQLQDPYQGFCNAMNDFSYWLAQPAYREPAVNKLMSHSATPVGKPCPEATVTNEKNVFAPGSQVVVSASYRDPIAGQQSQLSLIRPDGTIFQNWTFVNQNTAPAVSLAFTHNLPANALIGVWKFRVIYETKTYEHSFLVRAAPFDFDGDGKSDVSVFRPSNGAWYLSQSQNGFTGASFGQNGDKIVPADYDGDGKTDIAVFRNGTWYLNRSQLGFTGISFGETTDVPMPADYDGDGKADVAVFRPSTGVWYLNRSTLGFTGVAFGQAGDKPHAGDFDGDGKTDIAVYRAGIWYLNRSQLGFTGVSFGDANDIPVPADYDGDGKTDVAVFRPSNGTWYLNRSQMGITGVSFGQAGDKPVPADYDGDGKIDVAVYRPTAGAWYLNRSTAGFTGVPFGLAEDSPAPNAFVR